jgi:uncharacterized protein YqhQ
MMRSPSLYATAVRTPQGRIVVQKVPFTSVTRRVRPLNIPIIRGVLVLAETLFVGLQALRFSASQSVTEAVAARPAEKVATSAALAGSVAAALGVGFLMFFYAPLALTELLNLDSGVLFNIVDGVFRLAIFLLYIVTISRWKEMRRIFQYHGAEHMAIFAYEAGYELTIDRVGRQPRLHPRCGTNFLFVAVIMSIIVFVILGRPQDNLDRLARFAMIPLIAGLAFEIIRLSSRKSLQSIMRAVIWPGLMLQRLTTQPPTDDMLEVAIAALESSLDHQLAGAELVAG